MHNECHNIFIVEAVSLILLGKLTVKHNTRQPLAGAAGHVSQGQAKVKPRSIADATEGQPSGRLFSLADTTKGQPSGRLFSR